MAKVSAILSWIFSAEKSGTIGKRFPFFQICIISLLRNGKSPRLLSLHFTFPLAPWKNTEKRRLVLLPPHYHRKHDPLATDDGQHTPTQRRAFTSIMQLTNATKKWNKSTVRIYLKLWIFWLLIHKIKAPLNKLKLFCRRMRFHFTFGFLSTKSWNTSLTHTHEMMASRSATQKRELLFQRCVNTASRSKENRR